MMQTADLSPKPSRIVSAFCLVALPLLLSFVASLARADTFRAYLLTMGPGAEVYEKFGHNAIWLHDPTAREEFRDVAFHYGLFEFDSTFIFRFIQKDLRYSMGAFDAQRTVEIYRDAGRWVRRQELNLSQRQILALRDFLWWNARPENARYNYDYYRDNCSTRIRDALDRAADGQLRPQTASRFSVSSYRSETRRCLACDFAACTGIDFMLGRDADLPISDWDLMFLPPSLADQASGLIVQDETGKRVSLVAADEWLVPAAGGELPVAPPGRLWIYGLMGLSTAGLLLGLLHFSPGLLVRRLLALALMAWCLFTGLSGVYLAYTEMCTAHHITCPNENLLHASPLALLLAVLVMPVLRRGREAPRRKQLAAWTAGAMLAFSLLGALAKIVLPACFSQHDWEFIAWLLPANAALAIIFCRVSYCPQNVALSVEVENQ